MNLPVFRWAPCLILCLTFGLAAQADEVDLAALTAQIEKRSGDYGALVDILEGPDSNRALAAFDVMMETGNKSLAEIAMTSALAANDARLRARALWETLLRRDTLVIEVDADALAENEAALAHLEKWHGLKAAWPLHQKFPATQCINLISTQNACRSGAQITVSGLKVDMKADHAKTSGAFVLGPDGVLHGTITSAALLNTPFPARITLR